MSESLKEHKLGHTEGKTIDGHTDDRCNCLMASFGGIKTLHKISFELKQITMVVKADNTYRDQLNWVCWKWGLILIYHQHQRQCLDKCSYLLNDMCAFFLNVFKKLRPSVLEFWTSYYSKVRIKNLPNYFKMEYITK